MAGADVAVGVACLLWTAGVTGLALDGLLGSGGGEPDLTVAILGTGAGSIASAAFVRCMSWSGAGLRVAGMAGGRSGFSSCPLLAFSAVWVFALEWAGSRWSPTPLAMVEGESSALVVAMVLLYEVGAPHRAAVPRLVQTPFGCGWWGGRGSPSASRAPPSGSCTARTPRRWCRRILGVAGMAPPSHREPLARHRGPRSQQLGRPRPRPLSGGRDVTAGWENEVGRLVS